MKMKKPKPRLPKRKPDGRMPKPDQKVVDRLAAWETQERGRKICGAWRPVKGWVCCKSPLKGRTRCKDCGGSVPRGRDSTSYKHGRYSKTVPQRLFHRFEGARKDPQLLSLRSEIALLDAQLWDLVEHLDDLGVAVMYMELNTLRRSAIEASKQEPPDTKTFNSAIGKIFELIDRGSEEWDRIKQISELAERKKKLVESERKALVEMRYIITIEEQNALMARTLDIIYRNVTDDKVLASIESEFEIELLAVDEGVG